MQKEKILEVQGLTKKFKDFVAVDDISFHLLEGEILGLLGPNGAGKTTTLQMLLGVLTPTAGEIVYFGKSLRHFRSEILEQINFSSTYTNLPWDLTVRENLVFLSYFYRLTDREKRIQELVDTFELGAILSQPMHELSAGQITRVNLAKAFMNQPKVLLLDEPTASLDPDIAHYIRKFLLTQREQHRLSMVITSHNMTEVEELCDRVLFIHQGKIFGDDTPANLAKKLNIARMELLVQESSLSALIAYCQDHQLRFETEGHLIILYLPTREVFATLQALHAQHITYDEISITPPRLEDYFLQMTQQHSSLTKKT